MFRLTGSSSGHPGGGGPRVPRRAWGATGQDPAAAGCPGGAVPRLGRGPEDPDRAGPRARRASGPAATAGQPRQPGAGYQPQPAHRPRRSRRRPADYPRCPPPLRAVQLLTRRIGRDRAAAEPGPITEIATLCARLPLALAVAAARAAARPASRSLTWPLSCARARADWTPSMPASRRPASGPCSPGPTPAQPRGGAAVPAARPAPRS
jgi:hypothetical protein